MGRCPSLTLHGGQAISIGKVQLNNQISKTEEVLAWLIPLAVAQRPSSPTFSLRTSLRLPSFLFSFFGESD